jgi:hypothetical protein
MRNLTSVVACVRPTGMRMREPVMSAHDEAVSAVTFEAGPAVRGARARTVHVGMSADLIHAGHLNILNAARGRAAGRPAAERLAHSWRG